ncbi:MAG: TolC family protein [Bacteroidetes bacterium]|jgi:outer membrane protein TolC|nr:TolC family protein [Bacteroidota bacterium]
MASVGGAAAQGVNSADTTGAPQEADGELLTLEEALAQAQVQNVAVRSAENELAITENDASIGNAGFLPQLTASGNRNTSITTTEQQFIDQEPRRTPDAETTRQAARATLSWRAFEGLGRFATLQRLQAEQAGQAERTRGVRADVLTEVTVAYLSIVREQQQLAVLEEAVAISEERLRLTELRNRLGAVSDLAVRQARVDLNADRGARLRQESTVTAARARLNRLLDDPNRGAYRVETRIPIDTRLTLDELAAEARTQNPQLRSARQGRRAAAQERREIRAERLPTVDLEVQYEYSDQSSESGFVQFSESYGISYGVAVSVDLFDGLNRRRRAQNAQIRERNARLAIQELETQLTTALQEEFASFDNRLALIALEEENLEAARANVEVALRQFELGVITPLELREVQEALVQAESRLVDTRFEARVSEAELRRLAGQR